MSLGKDCPVPLCVARTHLAELWPSDQQSLFIARATIGDQLLCLSLCLLPVLSPSQEAP